MKPLGIFELKPDDLLEVRFRAALNLEPVLQREVEPFLQSLERWAGDWMPDIVEGKRRRKYSRDSVWKALEEERGGKNITIGLYRSRSPALEMTLRLRLLPDAPELSVGIALKPLSFLEEESRCRAFVELVRDWATYYSVTHATATSLAEEQLTNAPYFGRDVEIARRDGYDKVYEVCWLNVFGPKLVESIGRERVLSTPAHKVEALPNGSVLLVLRPTAADFASDEARILQARAHVHLRPDLNFDTVLRNLRERSAALSPVEPRFHPDLAPLLSQVADRAPISERQRRISELNAFKPPEPEEWLPVALPADVESPERVLTNYGNLSEGLVAALHTNVPSIMEETPESLTDLDFYFWRESFPERYTRELIDSHTAPALGAYLGDVLVRRLGGQWILRKKLEESQVRVGNRVWLPFLRTRRYMQCRQSLLDYSLTQFFREAERHRS